MFKKLATTLAAASIAAGGLLGSVVPAQAGTCWYIPKDAPPSGVTGSYCRTSLRVIDGLKVYFVTDGNGLLHRFTFWDDGTVDHKVNGKVSTYEWEKENDGSYRIYFLDGFEFIFID